MTDRITPRGPFYVSVFGVARVVVDLASYLPIRDCPRGKVFVSHVLFPEISCRIRIPLVFTVRISICSIRGSPHVVVGIVCFGIFVVDAPIRFSVSVSLSYCPIILRLEFPLRAIPFFSFS